MPHDINVQRRAASNLATMGESITTPALLSYDKYALTGQVAELMASKVFLSKTQLLLIIQSPVLLCCGATLQYLQCCKRLFSHRLTVPEVASCFCMSHNSICSTSTERGKRDKLLSSLIKEHAGLWRCMSVNMTEGWWRVCIVFKSLTRQVEFHHHAVMEKESVLSTATSTRLFYIISLSL